MAATGRARMAAAAHGRGPRAASAGRARADRASVRPPAAVDPLRCVLSQLDRQLRHVPCGAGTCRGTEGPSRAFPVRGSRAPRLGAARADGRPGRRGFPRLDTMTTPSLSLRRTAMGLSADSFQSIRFASPHRLLEVDRLMTLAAAVGAAGAHGGMTQIDFDWARRTRRMKEELGMYVEIQTFLPREDPAVFEHAVNVAKEAGATSLRVVCLLGRRYEMFDTLAGWKEAVAGFHRQIAVALPIVERHRMPLGIENHKDWRGDEQAQLLKSYTTQRTRV